MSAAASGALRRAFGVDLRSLALMRIALALTLAAELLYRLRTVEHFFTDRGIVTRELLARELPAYASPLALHSLSGSLGWQLLLFAVALLLAAMLALGYQTRVATIGSWLLLTSMHLRQPFALNGGDHLARLALFWSMFLPLGARFSLDARRHPERTPPDPQLCTAAGAALLVQIAMVYLSAGLVKTSPQWRVMGNALQWVLSEPQFATSLGQAVTAWPELLRALTFATRYVEIAAPLLIFAPLWSGPLRSAAALSLLGLQLGIGLTMKLGFFPAVSFATALALVPGWLWRRLGAAPDSTPADAAPAGPAAAARRPAWLRLRDALLLAVLVWVVWINLGLLVPGVRMPAWLYAPAQPLRLEQQWDMYYTVRRAEFVYDIVGELGDGREVGLATPGPGPGWRDVQRVRYRDHYFKDFWFNLRGVEAAAFLRPALARWLCQQWNADAAPAARMRSLELFFVVRHLSLDGDHGEWAAQSVLEHRCEGPPT